MKTFANVKEVVKIHLPKVLVKNQENGISKTMKAVTPNIYVKVLKDSKYNHAIFGHGLSV